MYYWTKKAEERARELGLEERKEGEIAYFGHKPLEGGMTAQAWERKGYVTKNN